MGSLPNLNTFFMQPEGTSSKSEIALDSLAPKQGLYTHEGNENTLERQSDISSKVIVKIKVPFKMRFTSKSKCQSSATKTEELDINEPCSKHGLHNKSPNSEASRSPKLSSDETSLKTSPNKGLVSSTPTTSSSLQTTTETLTQTTSSYNVTSPTNVLSPTPLPANGVQSQYYTNLSYRKIMTRNLDRFNSLVGFSPEDDLSKYQTFLEKFKDSDDHQVPVQASNVNSPMSRHISHQIHNSNQRVAPVEANVVNAISPASSRSTRSSSVGHLQQYQLHMHNSHHVVGGQVRHRDSMCSSAGASSVRRLIDVVRTTPSQFGPVYSRRVIHRNWALHCLTYGFLMSAFFPLFSLQSSVSSWWWPPEFDPTSSFWIFLSSDFGSLLLGCLCTVAALTSILMDEIIKRAGTLPSTMFSNFCALIFFSAHLYPTIYVLMPCYILMGVGLSLQAGSRVCTLMSIASKYSYVLSDEEEVEIEHAEESTRRDVVIHKLARWMLVAQYCGVTIGNLVTGLVMFHTWVIPQDMHQNQNAIDSMFSFDDFGERICGAAACPVPLNVRTLVTHYSNVTSSTSLVLPCKSCTFMACIFVACGVMAVAIPGILTDRLTVFQDRPEKSTCLSIYKAIVKTFTDPHLQLLTPLSLFLGTSEAFMYSDFTKTYVVCALDIYSVTKVFVALGVLQGITACTVSAMLENLKRFHVCNLGIASNACLLLVLLLRKPSEDDYLLLYVSAAIFGSCHAIWEVLIFNLLVARYQNNWLAAIAHHHFFRFLGMGLTFYGHSSFCNSIKLYVLVFMLILSVVSYNTLEWKLLRSSNNKNNSTINNNCRPTP